MRSRPRRVQQTGGHGICRLFGWRARSPQHASGHRCGRITMYRRRRRRRAGRAGTGSRSAPRQEYATSRLSRLLAQRDERCRRRSPRRRGVRAGGLKVRSDWHHVQPKSQHRGPPAETAWFTGSPHQVPSMLSRRLALPVSAARRYVHEWNGSPSQYADERDREWPEARRGRRRRRAAFRRCRPGQSQLARRRRCEQLEARRTA